MTRRCAALAALAFRHRALAGVSAAIVRRSSGLEISFNAAAREPDTFGSVSETSANA